MLALALTALVALAQPDTTFRAPTPDAPPDSVVLNVGDTPVVISATEPSAAADRRAARPPVRIFPRLAPSALYSPNRGIGIGGGIGIANFMGRGSQATIDLRLQQRAQGAVVALYTGDPFDAPVYGFVSAGGTTTQRRRYYGLGPFSEGDDELFLDHREAQVEARLGLYPLGHSGLLVQPGVRFLYDRFGGINEASPNGADVLDALSAAAIANVGDQRYGLSAGVEVGTDLRDWRPYPRRGMFASVEARRFFSLDGSELAYNRLATSAVGYLPIRGRTTVIAQFNAVLTRGNDADGDGVSDPIPFFYLPTLDDRLGAAFKQDRLIARDALVGSLGVRLPLVDFLGVYGFDALVMGFLGNVYDDAFDQFRPAISFDTDTAPDSNNGAALRPGLGLGIGLVNLDKERVVLGGLVGIGAGGVTLATLRVAYDLRDARPLFR